MFQFFKQQIFPGFYAMSANKKISKFYKELQGYEVESLPDNTDQNETLLEQFKEELADQLEKKNKIEDKAKSLLFVITLAITLISFSQNYIKSLERNNLYDFIMFFLVFSILNFILGAIRTLQTLNVKVFNVYQSEVTIKEKKFFLNVNITQIEILKGLIKEKELNNLILSKLTNLTYASFILIRNGIILFGLFFISTAISSTFYNNKASPENRIERKVVQINDTIKVRIPYSLELKYELDNLK